MKSKPSPFALASAFERATRNARGIEHRKMFGYPAVFVRGNMFAGLLRNQMVVKLANADLKRMLALPGARPLVAMKGRVMRQWAVVPRAMHGDVVALKRWLSRAKSYCRSLPPKRAVRKASRRS